MKLKGKMKAFNKYSNVKYEMEIFKERLQLISKYEERFNEEKKELNELINFQTIILTKIEEHLNKLNGIENKLYSEIIINGLKVSKAIEKIAFEEEKDVSTLWKNYYPKVKKHINELDLIIFNKNKKYKEANYERNN